LKPEVEFQYDRRWFFQTELSRELSYHDEIWFADRLLKRATSPNPKTEVIVHRHGCHLENLTSLVSRGWHDFGAIWQADAE